MPLLQIPTQTDPVWEQTTSLDGTEYQLRFAYNQRENVYHLTIANPQTGVDIISGLKLVTGWELIRRYNGIPGVPPGAMMALTTTSDDSPAGLGELGNRVILYYADVTFVTTGT